MSKVISLCVSKDACHSHQDPFNPRITHVTTLLPFREAVKLERGNANVRNPMEKKPLRDMLNTIKDSPQRFHRQNLGITYLCERVGLDRTKSELQLVIPENPKRARFGVVNGGHTLEAIQRAVEENKDVKAYVKVHIQAEEEENNEEVASIVQSLNTSTPVQAHTFYEYQNKYEDLKRALKAQDFDLSLIAFREGETGKEWEVREIIQRMSVYLKRWKSLQPASMYKSKGKALELFVSESSHHEFVELYDVLVDILTLPEYIQSQFSTGKVLRGRKPGKLRCAKLVKQFVRPGTPYISEHQIDLAGTLPIAAAFRKLLSFNESTGRLEWKYSYKEVFEAKAPELYDILSKHSAKARTSSQLGSDAEFWAACSDCIMGQLLSMGEK